MTRTKLFLLVSILTILLAIFGGLYWLFNQGKFGQHTERGYTEMKPQIQWAVIEYWVTHQEKELPIGATNPIGTYNVTGVGSCDIIDICQIVNHSAGPLRMVPDGFARLDGGANDNFDDPACNLIPTASGQHYVWVIDDEKNVHSVCDQNSDGIIE